jgi:hypothetical protein
MNIIEIDNLTKIYDDRKSVPVTGHKRHQS